MKTKVRFPNSNMGWHKYYVKRFNKDGNPYSLYLAMLYFTYYLAFGDDRPIPA